MESQESGIELIRRENKRQDVEKAPAPEIGCRPEVFRSTFTEILFIATCSMAVGMSSLLSGTNSVITLAISKDLNMTNSETTWIVASSSLTCGAFLLFFARFADLFGRKIQLVISLFLFSVFVLAAGFSRTAIALDVLNGVLGLLSASAVPAAIGTLGVTYGKGSRRKNHAFAAFSAANPLGFVFGTVFGGIATRLFHWRASYFLLAIIYLVNSVVAFFTMPEDKSEKLPFNKEALKRFDILGAVLTIGGFGLLASALSLGGNAPQGWMTPYVLVLLILGVFLIVGFVLWEIHFEHPLLPMHIWKDRDFSLIIFILFLSFLAFPESLFWMTLYIQRYWTGSALHVALYVLPAAVVGALVNIFAGAFLHKFSNKLLMGGGCLVFITAFLLLALNRSKDYYWPFIFPAFCIVVWGADLQFNVANMYITSNMSATYQSVAGGLLQTVTRLATALGFGITTAIFGAVQKSPPATGYHSGDYYAPYAGTFWWCTATCAASILLVPFLRVGTQGHGEGVL